MTVDETLIDEVAAAEAAADDEPPADTQYDEPVDVDEEEVTAEHRVPEAAPPDELGDETDADAEEAPPLPGLVKINAVAGVPLFFLGQPHRPWVAQTFLRTLEATIRQTQARIPPSYGPLRRIQELGMWVPPPDSDRFHTTGRACDWHKLEFEHVKIDPGNRDHAASSRSVRRRYWGFAAICRSNSCFVLHGLYNADHERHIHHDNGISVAFNTRPATVKLCQALLNDVFGHSLDTDGGFGQLTQRAMTSAFQRLQIQGTVNDVQAWVKFLRASARLAFHSSPPA